MPPRHRRGLPLHYCADCASGNPTRRPIGRRRRWRGRGAQRAASKHRVVCGPRCARPANRGTFGSVPRLQRGHGAARRDVEHPPRGAPKGQQARKARPLARASAVTQWQPTRPGLLIESNLRGYSRRCRCRAGIQGAADPRPCCQLAVNPGLRPSPPPHKPHIAVCGLCDLTTLCCCGTLQITVTGISSIQYRDCTRGLIWRVVSGCVTMSCG